MRRFQITLQRRSGERRTIVLGPFASALAMVVIGLVLVLVLAVAVAVGYVFVGVLLVILLLGLIDDVFAGAFRAT
jgi:hypothetical protein